MYIHIRVNDISYIPIQHIMQRYSDKLQKYLLVKHTNTETCHYHCHFWTTISQTQVIRSYVKRNYTNKEFCVKVGDEKGYQYMLHPGSEVIETNISFEEIKGLREKSREHKEKLKKDKGLKAYLFKQFEVPSEDMLMPHQITPHIAEFCISRKTLLPAKHYGKQLIHTLLAYDKYKRNKYACYQYLDDYYLE